MRTILVPVLITMAIVPAVAADTSRPPVPLRIDEHGGVSVQVRVNDAGPFTFLLDTGTARSVVADDLALELAAPSVARSEIATSAGSAIRNVVHIASLTMGASRVEGVLAPVVPALQLSQLGRGVRGLLGQDFLSGFNYTLDYRRTRLTWEGPRTCDERGAVRMVAAEGRFVMTLEDGRGTPIRLVPDSGAEVPVLFRAPGTERQGRSRIVNGITGPARARMTRLTRLRVGAVTLGDVDAYLVDRDDADADGLLPLHGFSSVSFAAGAACVVVRR